jgi:hypothetical protein
MELRKNGPETLAMAVVRSSKEQFNNTGTMLSTLTMTTYNLPKIEDASSCFTERDAVFAKLASLFFNYLQSPIQRMSCACSLHTSSGRKDDCDRKYFSA